MARRTVSDHQRRIADAVESMPDTHIECRDFGHSWRPLAATWLDGGNLERVLTCARCSTRRYQILDRQGYVLSGHYAYADHYLIEGIGRMTADDRAAVRLASIQRSTAT
jgi:hypothetical protein